MLKNCLTVIAAMIIISVITSCASGPADHAKAGMPVTAVVNVTALVKEPVPPPAAEVTAPAGTTLQWKLRTDKVYRYKISMEMNADVSMPMGNMTTKNKASATLACQLQGIDEKGNIILRQKIESIQVTSDTPMKAKVDFDSSRENDIAEVEKSGPEEMKKILFLLGKSFTVKITGQGEIMETKGVDMPDGDVAQCLSFFEDSMFALLPVGPVTLGASWEKNTETAIPMAIGGTDTTMKINNRFTYTGNGIINNRSCAQVSQTVNMPPFTGAIDHPMLGKLDMKITLSEGSGGGFSFDIAEGVLVRNESKIIQKVAMPLPDMNIPKEMKSQAGSGVEIIMNTVITKSSELLD